MALLLLNYTMTRFLLYYSYFSLIQRMILIYEDHHVPTGICSIHVLRRVPVPLMVSLNFLENDHCQWQYHNYYSSYRQKKRLIITSSDDWGVIKINITVNFNKFMPEAKLFPYRK